MVRARIVVAALAATLTLATPAAAQSHHLTPAVAYTPVHAMVDGLAAVLNEQGRLFEEALLASIPPPPPPVVERPSYTTSQTGGGAGGALACIRAHESDSAGGYGAVSSGGTYRGAYQFLQSTWDNAAAAAGRGDLVGRDPATVSPADQDAIAAFLYDGGAGASHWNGSGC